VKRNVGRTVKWREQQQKYSLLDYETLQNKIFSEQIAAARNDVIAKKIASGLFQNL